MKNLKIRKGVFAGKCLVTNKEGKAIIPFYNTKEKNVGIFVPTVELEEYDEEEKPEVRIREEEKALILKMAENGIEKEMDFTVENRRNFEKGISEESLEVTRHNLFTDLMELLEMLKNIRIKEIFRHKVKRKMIGYILEAKEAVLGAKKLNIVLGERVLNRLSKFANIFKGEESYVSDYGGLVKLLENDIKELVMTLDPDDVDKFNKNEKTMDFKFLQNKNDFIIGELGNLKKLLKLRRIGEKTNRDELANFLYRIRYMQSNNKYLKDKYEKINYILENTMTRNYVRVLDEIIELIGVIQQKLELQGIKMGRVYVIG